MLSNTTRDTIPCYSSTTIGAVHGMFGCIGGTSSENYASLNLSFGVGDERERVQENRALLKGILDIAHLVSSKQVHGDKVAVIKQIDHDLELVGYDALITNRPDTGLLIQQADCQAVLLHDPEKQVIAAIHNGWRGSVANIIAETIRSMQQYFNVNPVDIRAVISPSLGPCCGEFINYRLELPTPFQDFQRSENHFDFWAISRWQLRQTGINDENIEVSGICTVCNTNYFSYRRARKNGNGITGRNGSIIALPA